MKITNDGIALAVEICAGRVRKAAAALAATAALEIVWVVFEIKDFTREFGVSPNVAIYMASSYKDAENSIERGEVRERREPDTATWVYSAPGMSVQNNAAQFDGYLQRRPCCLEGMLVIKSFNLEEDRLPPNVLRALFGLDGDLVPGF